MEVKSALRSIDEIIQIGMWQYLLAEFLSKRRKKPQCISDDIFGNKTTANTYWNDCY